MPTRPILLALATAIALAPAIPAATGAQSPRSAGDNAMASPTDPQRVAKLRTAFPEIDSLMRAFAERSKVPGIAYGIVVDGKLAHVGTAGYRELSSRSPVDTGTVFRIASMTKSFTAVAILQLRDEGKLSLEDPAERYVPELAKLHYPTTDSPKITIRHLLSHSTGFPEDNPWGDRQLADTDEQMTEMMRGGIPFSTIADLSGWVGFMLDAWPPRDGGERGPLRRASRREMQQVVRYNGATVVRDTSTGTLSLSAGGYGYALGVRETCLFDVVVSHTGGLPGFGSIMLWLPHYGVGIVGLGNLTYTGWRGPTDQALSALARTGALEPRAPRPAPILVQRREQVSRLVTHWNDALADSVAAMNLYLDESKDRRRAAIERVREGAGDGCRNEGPFVAENALRGRWRMRCATGDLRVSITLAPTEPAAVQFLDVRPIAREESLAPAPACR